MSDQPAAERVDQELEPEATGDRSMVATMTVAGLAIIIVGLAAWFFLRPASLDDLLDRAGLSVRDQLPMVLTDEITLTTVAAEDDALVFGTVTSDSELTLEHERVVAAACGSEILNRILDREGRIIYRLSTIEGDPLSEIAVDKTQCPKP